MDYKIETLGEMIFAISEGSTREEAKEKVEAHLLEQNIKPTGWFYFEMYNSKGVSGAMTFAKINKEIDKSKKVMVRKIDEAPYFILELPYETYVQSGTPGSDVKLDVESLIKKEGYRLAEWPYFEFLPDTDPLKIRVYIKLK